MTKEEFGIELFEAIRCCGALLAIQDQTNASVHHRKDLADLKAKRETIKQELIGHMQQFSAEDDKALVQRYPFIATL